MAKTKTGLETARDTAEGIKKSSAEEKDIKVKEVISALGISAEMQQMYKDNRDVGASNLGQSLPTLKVHYANQSKNELPDGEEPNNGWFFYSETQEQFESVDCHILSISKGYRTKKPERLVKPGENPIQFQQLLSGIIIEDGKPTKPFLMFMKGLSLSPMWEFGKEARKYTKGENPVPLFALKVHITAEKEKTQAGNNVWITQFNIITNENDLPVLVTDPGIFTFLKEHVETVENTMKDIVANQSSETEVETIQPDDDDFEESMDAIKAEQ